MRCAATSRLRPLPPLTLPLHHTNPQMGDQAELARQHGELLSERVALRSSLILLPLNPLLDLQMGDRAELARQHGELLSERDALRSRRDKLQGQLLVTRSRVQEASKELDAPQYNNVRCGEVWAESVGESVGKCGLRIGMQLAGRWRERHMELWGVGVRCWFLKMWLSCNATAMPCCPPLPCSSPMQCCPHAFWHAACRWR